MTKRGPRAEAPRVWRESLDDDMVVFSLSANASDIITEHAPGKVVTTEFLRSLTQAQLELFINVSMLADNSGIRRLAQKDKAAAEQFALACILAGKGVSIREKPTYKPNQDYLMTQVAVLQSRHMYPQESPRAKARFKVKRVTHDGIVWCPRTPNETWLARRKGSVYFTGNSPKPDPEMRFRGMSWLTPILREIQADKAATKHKERFFANGAQLGVIVRFDKEVGVDALDAFKERFNAAHKGEQNAYQCLHPGTEVTMWDGRRLRAADVKVGDVVVAWADGRAVPGMVAAAEWQPPSPIVTVTTQRGRVIKTNDRHPYLARRPTGDHNRWLGAEQWLTAAELRPGDLLTTGLGWASDAIPDEITAYEAWVLGVIVGDGCTISSTPVVSAWEVGIRDRLQIGHRLNSTGKGHDYRVLGVTKLCRSAGIMGKRSWEKRVPHQVLAGSAKVKAAFISGLIDTDGHVSDPERRRSAEVGITSTSRELLADVQHLLASLGINASLSLSMPLGRKGTAARGGLRVRDAWRLIVLGNRQAGVLYSIVDLAHPEKARRLCSYARIPCQDDRSRRDRVVSVDISAPEPTIGIEVADHHTHVTGGVVTHNTLFLGGGADVTVASADMKQVDFKGLAGGGESRIASAAGIHPTIAGFSEGLQGSSLNAGNFGAARRLVADKTLRHLWGVASSSLQTLLKPPSATASLWYDTRDVAFLREDATDSAAIVKEQMLSIESGVRGGYDPATVVTAVATGDLTVLKHTGLYSVQLQAPGTVAPPALPQEQLPVVAEG